MRYPFRPATAAILVLAGAALVTAAEPARVVDKAFASGGLVTMDLAAGKYTIQGTANPRIHLTWDTRDPHDASKVWTRVETSGTAARIETDGPHDGFEVKVEVPFNSDLTIRLSAGDGCWTLQVEDNGHGIAAADQALVFGKFAVATQSSRGAGTGLGLWIVSRLVQAMGGDISLRSGPEQGCAFTVRIPERDDMSTNR